MQVYALVSAHVVWFAGIDEEVRLCACFYACSEERQAVLWHHRCVVVSRDDLQLAFQLSGLRYQRCLLVALGIGLRRVHVALTVHHLIPSPVDDGPSSHAHLEHLGIVGHQRDGHESPEAPSVNAQSFGVYIGQRLQIFHAFHLVLHLYLSQLSERGLLKLLASVLAAAIVEDEEYISLLRHVCLPRPARVVPAGRHVVGVRSSVDIHHGGIFLCGVEIGRLHHAVVQVGHPVGGLDGAAAVFGHLVALPGVACGEILLGVAFCGVCYADAERHVGFAVFLKHPLSRCRQCGMVHAAPVVEQLALARGDVHRVDVALYGRLLVGLHHHAPFFLVEAQHFEHHEAARGELPQLLAVLIK